MVPAEGRFSDLLFLQFQRRVGCRVPFAVTRLPYCVCEPLLPTNQPASGALPLPAASQRLPLPGWLRHGVAKSVPFLALQSNVVSFCLFSPPSSQTPYSQKCPFASRPPTCPRAQHAALPPQPRCASLRVLQRAPNASPKHSQKKKEKNKKKEKKSNHQVLSFCGQRKGAPRVFPP